MRYIIMFWVLKWLIDEMYNKNVLPLSVLSYLLDDDPIIYCDYDVNIIRHAHIACV